MSPAAPRPDFLRPVHRPGALAWAGCATGLLVLAAAGLDARSAWLDLRQSQQGLASARSQSPPGLRLAATPSASTAAASTPGRASGSPSAAAGPGGAALVAAQRQAEQRQTDARRWLQRLAHPWPEVWTASEVASEGASELDSAGRSAGGIAWLGFEHDGRASLRLSGLAPDAVSPQRAAQALRAQRGGSGGGAVWREVVLSRLERVPEGQRFEITAVLAASAELPR